MSKYEERIAPINHSAGSALGSTAAGAAGGAVKVGVITGLSWPLVAAAIGGVIGSLVVGVATGGVGFAITPMMIGAGVGTILGGIGGFFTAIPMGTLGGAVGAFTGGAKASNRVSEERGAAAQVEAQIAMARAQNPAPAATTIIAPNATSHARTEQRGNRVTDTQVHGAEYNGRVFGPQQLAAAR